MRRLYFLLPDADTASALTEKLLVARIPERKIHVIASHEQVIKDHHLPGANLLQETDIVPAIERGMAIGGATGVLAGVAAIALPAVGLGLGAGAVLLTGLAGAGFGAAVAPMLGISVRNSQIDKFWDAIQRGQLLMMVDVPPSREEEIRSLVRDAFPQAEVGGTEPHQPAFP